MHKDDIGDISSFAAQPLQKGLITFYQEQWNHSPSHLTKSFINTHPQQHELSKTIQLYKTPHKISSSLHQSPKLPFLLTKNQPKLIQNKDTLKIINKHFRLSEKAHPLNLSIVSKIQQGKQQGRQKKTEINSFKKLPVKERVKQRRIFESLHVQNYPFQQKVDENEKGNKLKNQTQVIRIKMGSAFQGYHRSNVSISAVELSKQHSERRNKQVSKEWQKTMDTYEKYNSSKKVVRYMFPIISPRKILLRKDNQEIKNSQSEDNLNKLHNRIKQPC